MAAYRPLQRPTPHLHQSGAIKFRVVLSMARAQRAQRRKIDASETFPRWSCLISRFDRVRDDMIAVRQKIASDRAFWSVDNLPTTEFKRVRVESHGHVWHEARPVAVEPVAVRRAA